MNSTAQRFAGTKLNSTAWHGVSSTQKGAVGEQLIAAWLIIASEGRLSPFQPIADDGGIDLLVYDKKTGAAIPLQIKTRTKTLRKNPLAAHFELRKATFNAGLDGCLLAVSLSPSPMGAEFRCGWLIPLRKLESVANNRESKFVIRPSSAASTSDRYQEFQCLGIRDVAERIEKLCDFRAKR